MDGFYTFYKYMGKEFMDLSASEEDYIEMIYRIVIGGNGEARGSDLSQILHVKPPSVTKMVKRLSDMELVIYKKYGSITLTDKGMILGESLLKRHEIIEDFLKFILYGDDYDNDRILEETEKVEHTISSDTVKGIAEFLDFIKSTDSIKSEYMKYKDRIKKL